MANKGQILVFIFLHLVHFFEKFNFNFKFPFLLINQERFSLVQFHLNTTHNLATNNTFYQFKDDKNNSKKKALSVKNSKTESKSANNIYTRVVTGY